MPGHDGIVVVIKKVTTVRVRTVALVAQIAQ